MKVFVHVPLSRDGNKCPACKEAMDSMEEESGICIHCDAILRISEKENHDRAED